MTWGSVRQGDWVTTTSNVSVTVGLLGGTTIKRGTRGVINSVSTGWFSTRATVTFDAGLGTVRGTVPASNLRVVRKKGGIDPFTARRGRLAAARAALILFLAWPLVSWAAQYVWHHKGFDGITDAFTVGVIDSFGYFLTMLVTNPVRGIMYLGFCAFVSRLAWR